MINHELDTLTFDRYKELMHIGVQASLPSRAGKGFAPHEVVLPMNEGTFDVANRQYGELPTAIDEQYLGIAIMVSAYLMYIVESGKPVAEHTFLSGREWAYRGSTAGLNSYILYTNDADSDNYSAEALEVTRQYYGYDDYADPDMQRADENMLCLGMLALRRPDIFPALAERLPQPKQQTFIQTEPGIAEGALRGLAAIRRVARISAPMTELQTTLLERAL